MPRAVGYDLKWLLDCSRCLSTRFRSCTDGRMDSFAEELYHNTVPIMRGHVPHRQLRWPAEPAVLDRLFPWYDMICLVVKKGQKQQLGRRLYISDGICLTGLNNAIPSIPIRLIGINRRRTAPLVSYCSNVRVKKLEGSISRPKYRKLAPNKWGGPCGHFQRLKFHISADCDTSDLIEGLSITAIDKFRLRKSFTFIFHGKKRLKKRMPDYYKW